MVEKSERIRITVNKKPIEVNHCLSILDLLKHCGYPRSVAVFVNKKQLLMKDYETTMVKEGDDITFFRPLGGG